MIPDRPDAFTRDWLSEKLGTPAGSLQGFEAARIGTGQMCDSYRLALDWTGGEGPPTIIAKCPSTDPASRAIAKTVGTYRLEIGWYRDLANQIPVSCPACYHAEIAEDEVTFALLLEDRAPAEQGDQIAGATIAMIEATIREAAALHAPLWNSPRLDAIDWLQRRGGANQQIVRTMLPQLYAGFRDRYAERLAPEILAMGDAFIARLDRHLDRDPGARTLTHGDLRSDNLLIHPETGAVTLVDWQTVQIGNGVSDIAYLIGTSIAEPTLRAREERRLVGYYVDALAGRGITIDPDLAWADYRRSAFAGFVMAVFASMNVQRTERGDEMFAVMAERPARQILDLDSLAAI